MAHYSKDKVIDGLVRQLLKSGEWVVKQGRHVRIEHASTHLCITVPRTPSDHRAAQNWLHQVKRSGVTFQPEGRAA